MTKEEILYCLKADSVGYTESCNKCMYGDKTDVGTCYSKHLLAAIKVLEQEPCEPFRGVVYLTRTAYEELCYKAAKWNELEKCGDAISREDAIKAVCGLCDKSTGIFEENPHIDAVLEALENLPPVLPESKTEVLDKIRAEIEKYSNSWKPKGNSIDNAGWSACNKCIEIIDKYKAESEGKE